MNTVAVQSNLANLEHAFFVAEKLGVARLLDPEGKIATKGFVAKNPIQRAACCKCVGILTTV